MTLAEQVHVALGRLAAESAQRSVHRLPPERDLALRLGVSRTTIRIALDALERDGVIRRVRGRAGGAYLTGVEPGAGGPEGVEMLAGGPSGAGGRALLRSLNTVKGVPQMLDEQGFHGSTQVLSAGLVAAPPRVVERLGIPADSAVVSLLRLRFADAETLSLERMYLSGGRFVALLDRHLDSVYEAMRSQLGVRVCVADESIDLAVINDSVGALMGQPAGTPVLRLERVGYDDRERPVEYSVDLFRADRTRLNVRTAGPS